MDNLPKQRDAVSESPLVVTNNGAPKVVKLKQRQIGKPIGYTPTSWSDKLAHAVQQFPCLYDPAQNGHKMLAARELAWKQVGAQLDISSYHAKARWRTARDNYTRFKRAVERCPAEVAHLAPYYESFRFVDNYSQRDHGPQHSTPSSAHWERSASVGAWSEDSESATQRDASFTPCSTVKVPPMSPSPQPARRSVTVDVNVMDRLVECLETTKQSPDALDLMFMSFAATTRKLKPAMQAQVKLKVLQVIVDAEMEMAEQPGQGN